MPLPYANTSSGSKAREEIIKVLGRFGCESVGFMDEFNTKSLILAFTWRNRPVHLRASAQGWANAWLKENPYTSRMKLLRHDYEQRALAQGLIAINSILRDWVKGQVTAIETGILTFEHVFMPYMLMSDGRQAVEHIKQLMIGHERRWPAVIHSFQTEVAEECGVEAAIIFANIQHWIKHNQANGTNLREGKAWVYNSRAAWCEIFPYLGEKQIRNALEHLLASGFIIRENYSFGSVNRTYWYGLGERANGAHQPGCCRKCGSQSPAFTPD
jgi:hypothetical protein